MDFLLPHILYPLNICCGQLFTKLIHKIMKFCTLIQISLCFLCNF